MSDNSSTGDGVGPRNLAQDDAICKVCGASKKFNPYIDLCEACKKFFLRNRNNLDSVKCTTGLQNCAIQPNTRRCCTYCRLIKCFKIGIRGRGRIRLSELKPFPSDNNKQWNNDDDSSDEKTSRRDGKKPTSQKVFVRQIIVESNKCALERSPSLFDGAHVELALRTIISSATELQAMDRSPMRYVSDTVPMSVGPMELWGMVIKQMNFGRNIGNSYFDCWRDMVSSLHPQDVTKLICVAMVPTAAAYMALPGNQGAAMFGINNFFLSILLKSFPQFLQTGNSLRQLSLVMSEWNPSFIDASFLQAYLFFNDGICLKSSDRVAKIRSNILIIYRMYLASQLSVIECNKSLQSFMKIIKLVEEVAAIVYSGAAAFSQSNSSLVMSDKLWASMFPDTTVENDTAVIN